MQNLHPLFVHFPIAFLVAAIGAELLCLRRPRPQLDAVARWLLYLGTGAAALAALSGWLGAQSVAPVAAAAHELEDHQRLGFITLGTAAMLAFWRLGTTRAGGPRPRWLFTLGMIGLGAILWSTAQEGGELVYEYGLGTELTAPGGPLAESPDSAAAPARPDVPVNRDFR